MAMSHRARPHHAPTTSPIPTVARTAPTYTPGTTCVSVRPSTAAMRPKTTSNPPIVYNASGDRSRGLRTRAARAGAGSAAATGATAPPGPAAISPAGARALLRRMNMIPPTMTMSASTKRGSMKNG